MSRIALMLSVLFLSFSSRPVLAENSKTLLVNGVNAATVGDFGLDVGEWRNQESFAALRMRAQVQLVRIGFTSLSIGYQKVGFYTALRNLDKPETNRMKFDYRGPVAELHLFPDRALSFSAAISRNTGFHFQKADSLKEFGVSCEAADQACLKSQIERSSLVVTELTFQASYTFHRGLQVYLGLGQGEVKGKPSYEIFRPLASDPQIIEQKFESLGASSWSFNRQFVMFGVRGNTF